MITIYPDYYNSFKCTAANCRHNCCIGWEIDIDPDTADYYQTIPGDFGERIRKNITWDTIPCFSLVEGDRCPMLNSRGLCDIMLTLGEDSVCDICAEHPRFYNYLDSHTECGLGLCCESVCDLVIGKKDPVKLIGYTDELGNLLVFKLRNDVIALLQDRDKSIVERLNNILKRCSHPGLHFSLPNAVDMLLSLERLSAEWTDILDTLAKVDCSADYDGFNIHMKDRITEYEQLLVYIVYRYMISPEYDPISIAGFTCFVYHIIYAAGAAQYTKNGSFTFEDQADLIRMFSSEIEYSTENLDIILEYLKNITKQ